MRGCVVLCALALLTTATPARADGIPATLARVIDGDTAVLVTAEGEKTVRFKGLDAPEMKGQCEWERQAALQARMEVERLLGSGQITLEKPSRDKYGRVAAFVLVDGQPVHAAMIQAGLARPYTGGKRRGWCGP
jgi:endonuclease YncB( thermonuclease family)